MAEINFQRSGRSRGMKAGMPKKGAVRMAGVFLVSLCVVVTLAAQQVRRTAATPTSTATSTDLTKQARLEGKVVSSTGMPVPGAEVRLVTLAPSGQLTGEASYGAISNDDGAFAIEGIHPIQNLGLTATKTGYSPARYGAKTPGGAIALISLKAGESLKDVVLSMEAQGVLSGHIRDAAGDPVKGAEVILLHSDYAHGVRQLAASRSADTNDKGEFRLGSLTPGRYFLVAQVPHESINGVVQLATFFPGTADPRGAQPVEVPVGGEKGGLEIQLLQAHGFTLRGKVEPDARPVATTSAATSKNAKATSTSLVMALPEAVANGIVGAAALGRFQGVVRPDGTFEVKGVPSGSYVLQSLVLESGNERVTGQRPVLVGQSDVDGLDLTQSPGITLTGRVTVEGGSVDELATTLATYAKLRNPNNPNAGDQGIQLTLNPADASPTAHAVSATIKEDGSFTFDGLSPGRYAFDQGKIPATFIKTFTLDGQELTQKKLEITNSGILDIVLRRTAVRVTGTLKDEKGVPQPAAMVILWPTQAKPAFVYDGARFASTDRAGVFNLPAVTPGTYYSVAFVAVNGRLLGIREFQDMFTGQAEKVEVKEGEPLTFAPSVIIPLEQVGAAERKLP